MSASSLFLKTAAAVAIVGAFGIAQAQTSGTATDTGVNQNRVQPELNSNRGAVANNPNTGTTGSSNMGTTGNTGTTGSSNMGTTGNTGTTGNMGTSDTMRMGNERGMRSDRN